MLTLKSFHLFFIGLSIVLTSGFGMWGLLHHYVVLGIISLIIAVLLVFYGGYFVRKSQTAHLE